jgi:catechol 2,3-dioxygenase-like lactoylglutathione lyase family enzyme
MIDHVGIAVSDYGRAKEFYIKTLEPLGYSLVMEVEGFAGFGRKDANGPIATFWMHEADKPSGKLHIAFSAQTRKMVDEFFEAAIKAGGKDNGKPGIRKIYHPHYYGAFAFDPDGHNLEAVCHAPE